MIVVKNTLAALLVSAVFVLSVPISAQVEVVDASIDQSPTIESQASNDASGQGELFYQLQVLQEEVRMLRGLVEDQSHQLRQLKEQSMQRYIDLDRRIGMIGSNFFVFSNDMWSHHHDEIRFYFLTSLRLEEPSEKWNIS